MNVIRTQFDKNILIERLSKQYPRSTHDSTGMKIHTRVAPFRANYMFIPLEIDVYFDSFEQGTDVKFSVKPIWLYRVIVALLTIMTLYDWAGWLDGKGNLLFCVFSSLFPIIAYINQLWQVKECKSRLAKHLNELG